jgi:ubiquitin carboxyl-terminal hydrolase 4/11/15
MHDEVYDQANEAANISRENTPSASSPSDAYANLTLDGEPMAADSDTNARTTDHRPPPRAASPAKRLHSDMDSSHNNMDQDAHARQSSPRPTKPLPPPQRSLRTTSVEMADAASNASSDSKSASNQTSADLPSLDEQVNKVLELSRKPLQDRQVGFIVANSWLERVWARTPQYADKQREFSKSAAEGEIGPVDNSNLVGAGAYRHVYI